MHGIKKNAIKCFCTSIIPNTCGYIDRPIYIAKHAIADFMIVCFYCLRQITQKLISLYNKSEQITAFPRHATPRNRDRAACCPLCISERCELIAMYNMLDRPPPLRAAGVYSRDGLAS